VVEQKIRVLLAQPGLDGRDRSADMIAQALLEAQVDVIHNRRRQTPEMIAQAAQDHQVHLVQLSILNGDHLKLVPGVREALDRIGLQMVPVLVGGIIPEADQIELQNVGAAAVLGPHTHIEEIIQLVQNLSNPDVTE